MQSITHITTSLASAPQSRRNFLWLNEFDFTLHVRRLRRQPCLAQNTPATFNRLKTWGCSSITLPSQMLRLLHRSQPVTVCVPGTHRGSDNLSSSTVIVLLPCWRQLLRPVFCIRAQLDSLNRSVMQDLNGKPVIVQLR